MFAVHVLLLDHLLFELQLVIWEVLQMAAACWTPWWWCRGRSTRLWLVALQSTTCCMAGLLWVMRIPWCILVLPLGNPGTIKCALLMPLLGTLTRRVTRSRLNPLTIFARWWKRPTTWMLTSSLMALASLWIPSMLSRHPLLCLWHRWQLSMELPVADPFSMTCSFFRRSRLVCEAAHSAASLNFFGQPFFAFHPSQNRPETSCSQAARAQGESQRLFRVVDFCWCQNLLASKSCSCTFFIIIQALARKQHHL